MSYSPLKWRKLVVESYGSVAEFKDVSTVESIRALIAKDRKEFSDLFKIKEDHPAAISDDDVAKWQAQDSELAALDAELETWQQKRQEALQEAEQNAETSA